MFWLIFVIVIFILLGYIYVQHGRLSFGICKCSKQLTGKVTIVTGSNIGIGFETAKDFAFRGAKVILACRTESKAIAVRDAIIAATGNEDVHYCNLDLSSFKSIKQFADQIKKTERKLDILVNNAGDLDVVADTTEDGLLRGMQINYFGPFLLNHLLLPLLKSSAPSRIVNVASMAHKFGEINLENLNESTGMMKTYGNAKLCTVLSTVELNRRLAGTGVTVNALCPGFVATNIFSKVRNPIWRMLINAGALLTAKDCWQGAQTQVYLSVSPEVKNISGLFFRDCKVYELEDFAKNPDKAKKLWEVTERLLKLD